MSVLEEKNNSGETINKIDIKGYSRKAIFLKEQLGKMIKIEVIAGNNTISKIGLLEDSSNEYVIIRTLETDELIFVEIKDIVFATLLQSGYYTNQNNVNNMNNINMMNNIQARYPYY